MGKFNALDRLLLWSFCKVFYMLSADVCDTQNTIFTANRVGSALLYAPCISYLSEWFVAKRGLANGVIFAGTAAGGLVLPLIIPKSIDRVGIANTLRFMALGVAVSLAITLPFVKGRLPRARVVGPAASTSREYLKKKGFWIVILANTLQGFGQHRG